MFKFQVVESRGDAGHNVEYVLKLAEWIREKLPDVKDDHLFDIEKAVRTKIDQHNLCLTSLMGDSHENQEIPEHAEAEVIETGNEPRTGCPNLSGSGFSTQLRPKCLRCTKV